MPGPTPTFSGLYLAVADMARTVAFYRDLGFEFPDGVEKEIHVNLPGRGDGPGVDFGTQELTRGYNPGWRQAAEGTTNALQFSLPTRDAVDELYTRMTGLGHTGGLAPFDAFWGSRYAELRDPDGNVVGLQSPVDRSKGGPPPV